MFPRLAAEIDTLQVPLERDAIVGAIGLRDRLDAKIGTAVGEYAALGLHEVDGSVTMGSWLRHRAKLDSVAANVARERSKLVAGRVGRTSKLPLEARAAPAARASGIA